MANRIQLRRGTSTEWIQFNPVLAEAEFGVEVDTGRFKIGDGATPWQTLKYERPLESVDSTPSTLVLRDSNSSIKVKNVTLSSGGKLFGAATTADKLTTSRLIGASTNSDLTGSASFDGSSNLDINFILKTVFTGDTGQSYTKFTIDSKGRVTSAENPTTLSGYGILDAQPLNGILTSISSVGTGLGFLVKVDTNSGASNNTIVRSLSVSTGQLTVSNASGTTGNPILGLADTTVSSGSYNTASLLSTSGDPTVNTVKFDVDQYGRLTSVTTIPIATASETQKGLASFNSEDFDVSAGGIVTIASQGVDNDQLQNPKIILGTTDYVLGTTYTGFTTISDLTVNTNTLHVDKVNSRVGIGTLNPTAKLEVSGTVRTSGVITSSVVTGSSPFVVQSTTKVNNLNVDFLDDLTSLDFLRRTNDVTNLNNEGNQYVASNFWIDASNVTILDPIIDIGGSTKGGALDSNDNKDRGLTFQYYSGSSKRAFVGWDNSSEGFVLARDVTLSGEIVQGSSIYSNLDVGATTLRNGSFTIKTGGTGAGTLGATGETTTFTVAHTTGNTSISGILDVTSDLRINTNKFNITASSGNTSIAGTLSVTDNTTLNKNVTIVGSDTVATEYFKIQNGSAADKFIVDSSSGNTDIKGTLDVLGNVNINTNKFNIIASSGNTSIAGTLGVTGATTLSSTLDVTGNVFVNTNKFMITASSGNTTIAGTLGVAEATTLSSTLGVTGQTTLTGPLVANGNTTLGDVSTDTLTVNATSTFNAPVTLASSQNLTVGGDLTVTGNVTVNGTTTTVNSTTITVDDKNIELGSVASPTNVTADGGGITLKGATDKTLTWSNANSAWTSSENFDLASGKEYRINNTAVIDSTRNLVNIVNHTMSGNITVNTNKFTVAGTTGNTSIAGTLGVTGATTLSSTLAVTDNVSVNTNKFNITAATGNTSIAGTLSVTDNVTLNKNVTILGSDSASTELFKIQNASAVDKFTVDSSSGNTTIAGTLGVTGNTTLSGTLGVTNLATFNNGVTISGSTSTSLEFFRITDGSTTKFEVDSATGNTSIVGTLGVTAATTLSSTLGVTGNLSVNTNKFTVNATSGNTLVAGTLDVTNDLAIATNKFNVASATGNTSIAGTLGVTGLITANAGITLSGSAGAGEDFIITNGTSTRFSVESASGNTSIVGTLGVTAATTLSSTLAVTGVTTLTGLLNANGGIAVDTNAFTVADGTGNTAIAGTLAVTGNTTLTGDLAVNGADITSTATTFNLLNSTVTTLNVGGASTSVSIGASTGSTTINNANTIVTGDLAVNGGDLTSSSTSFNLLNSTVTTLNIGGAANTVSIGSASSTATFNNNVTVSGNLTVNGTTTTINSTTLSVDDKNIELGSVGTPTDTTADGGGITLLGATNKTLNWIQSSTAWTSSEHFNILTGKEYRINNTSVLTSTTLGSGVVNSSLTSVGTLTALTVSGNTNINNIGIASGTSTITTTSTNDLVLTPGGKTTTTKGFDVSGTTNLTGNTNISNIGIASGTSTITTTSTNNLVLTPGGKTTTSKDFDISGVLTTTGNTNINNISIATGTSTITTTSTNNLVLTPGGKTTTTKDLDITATLNVVGQFNSDNLRIDGNQLSSTTGEIDIRATGNNRIIIGNVTTGTTIRFDPTISLNVGTGANTSDAQLTIYDNIVARQALIVDGDVTIRGSLTTSGGGGTASYTTYLSTATVSALTTTLSSTGTSQIYNLDAVSQANGGTIQPTSLGVKYTVLVTRTSDNQRMMFELMGFWDDAYSTGEIHTTEYAISNPNNLPYTFDMAWVNPGGNIGTRATLRITNVPNGDSVSVKMFKTYFQ